jgi:hypothetical protein
MLMGRGGRRKLRFAIRDEAENLIFEAGFGEGGIDSTFLSLLTHYVSKFETWLLACIKFRGLFSK